MGEKVTKKATPLDTFQYTGDEDWQAVPPWLTAAQADGRLVVEPAGVALVPIPGLPSHGTILKPTDWLLCDVLTGAVSSCTDAEFQLQYSKG